MMPATRHKLLAALSVLLLFAMFDLSIRATDAWQDEGEANVEDMDTLVEAIFDTELMAFEALGILLTAAMIGALVIARPIGHVEDDEVPYEPYNQAVAMHGEEEE